MGRSFLRRALEAGPMTFARLGLWYSDASRDHRATSNIAYSIKGGTLYSSKERLFDEPNASTLFILGSGQSVNELSAHQLEIIKSNASVGINYWFLHPLVPSVFALEGRARQDDDLSDDARRAQERLAVRANLQFSAESSPKVLHLRPLDGLRSSLFPLADEVWTRTFLYGRANLIARTARSLKRDLKLLVQVAKAGLLPRAVFPDNGSTVVRLVFLGIAQGFRHIVLVGVDLDARPHFYYSAHYSGYHADLTTLNPRPAGLPHETRHVTHRPFDTLDFLSTLGEVLNKRGTPSLWIGSASSELSSVLPLYQWEKCSTPRT